MYQEYFQLREAPFSIAPDPRYLYLSEQHREALAHLLYGVKGDGGFVLLTGEVGTGKTTICRGLIEQLPSDCDVALILNPRLTVVELLSTVCDEFGVHCPRDTRSIKVFVDHLNAYLLQTHAKGRQSVLIIDEAQNLSPSVLEQMRLLTNLETNQRKLLQIILLGQPELRDMLARRELRQLAQRIVARYHLGPLSREDTEAYVVHRLAVAGAQREIFPPSTLRVLHRLSGGIPRLINIIADRALLGAYAEGKSTVDRGILHRAAREALGEPRGGLRRLGSPAPVIAMAGTIGLAIFLGRFFLAGPSAELPAGQPTAPPTQSESPASKSLRKSFPAPAKTEAAPAAPAAPEPEGTAPPKAQRVELSNLRWSPEKPLAQSESLAFQSLFELWKVSPQPGDDARPCQRAEASGLLCFSGRGGLQDLLRLNHPAVLRFHDPEGAAYFGTISAIRDQTASVILAGEPRVVSLSDLEQLWKGEYTLFWRPPPQYGGALQVGDRGPAVDWLRQSLARAEGRSEPPAADNRGFDPAFQETVKRFQTANGLKSDGIVGPQTLIRLNAAIHGDDPHLTTTRKDG